MIKKRMPGILFIFLILMILSVFSVQAQINSTEEQQKVDKAYQCLEDKVEGKCNSLTTEEKIFSLLAIKECRTEVLNDSSNQECWPAAGCRLKTTAQAVLALDNAGANTDKAQQWLLSQNRTTTGLIWYLQIESDQPTTCNIIYTGFSGTVTITEDKKISGNAGQCLSLAQDDYWLEISSSCYNKEFSISCDKDFSTTLLFRKQDSSTIYVSREISSSAATGTTTEKVESLCFREGQAGNPCNYEGSLWAALVLDSSDTDVSSYLPYLITFAEDYQKFLPDAFLYLITVDEDYSNSLLSKQKNIGDQYYWQESGDMYYDTALALFPFKDEIPEKTNSKQWLLETQDTNGCWQNKLRNTAFILASVWPRDFAGDDGIGAQDCESAGYYCVNEGSCEGYGGQVLSDYYCPGVLSECCSVPTEQQTCAEKGGIVCLYDQICSDGDMVSAADTDNCCINGGICQTSTTITSECEQQLGSCRVACLSDEEEASYACEFSGDICCVQKTTPGKSYLWIWILLILIILVVIAIIFRDKLRNFLLRIKSKTRPRPGPGPMRPLGPPHYPVRRPLPERRILPPLYRPSGTARAPSKTQKELDEVLRKLKEMGK